MAKVKKTSEFKPLVVGNVGGIDVILSPRTQRDISMVQAGKARDQYRADKIQAALDAAQGRIDYKNRRDNLRIVLTKRMFLAVNGTGTKASGIFSKKQALEFLKPENIALFTKLANEMPDEPLPVVEDETAEGSEE